MRIEGVFSVRSMGAVDHQSVRWQPFDSAAPTTSMVEVCSLWCVSATVIRRRPNVNSEGDLRCKWGCCTKRVCGGRLWSRSPLSYSK